MSKRIYLQNKDNAEIPLVDIPINTYVVVTEHKFTDAEQLIGRTRGTGPESLWKECYYGSIKFTGKPTALGFGFICRRCESDCYEIVHVFKYGSLELCVVRSGAIPYIIPTAVGNNMWLRVTAKEIANKHKRIIDDEMLKYKDDRKRKIDDEMNTYRKRKLEDIDNELISISSVRRDVLDKVYKMAELSITYPEHMDQIATKIAKTSSDELVAIIMEEMKNQLE